VNRPAPFRRIKVLVAAVLAAQATLKASHQIEAERSKAETMLDDAKRDLFAYKSRGKGRGTISPRFGNKSGKYRPHQGARECARRRQQFFGETQP